MEIAIDEKRALATLGETSGIPIEIRADEKGFFAGLLLVCNLNEHQFNVNEGNINVRGKNQSTFFSLSLHVLMRDQMLRKSI